MASGLNYKGNKGCRLLNMKERLDRGEVLKKAQLAEEYGVTEKTIQRDIDALRNYLVEAHPENKGEGIRYDRRMKGYWKSGGTERVCK